MSPFRSALYPTMLFLKLTFVFPFRLDAKYSVSKSAITSCVALNVIFCLFGSFQWVEVVLQREPMRPSKVISVLSTLISTFSALKMLHFVLYSLRDMRKLLLDLELCFRQLQNREISVVRFNLWMQFFSLVAIQFVYRIVYSLNFSTCSDWNCVAESAFLLFCKAGRENYVNSMLVLFLILVQIIKVCAKELKGELKSAILDESKIISLRECHRKLEKCAENINSLFGIQILCGLLTTNINFQVHIFQKLNQMCEENELSNLQHILNVFSRTSIFLFADIGKFVICFSTCNSIMNHVKLSPFENKFVNFLFLSFRASEIS
jgi:hypothetical protein